MNRKRLILTVLLVVLVISVVVSFLRMPRQKRIEPSATPAPAPTRSAGARKAAPAPNDRSVRLDLLECRRKGFSGFRRNIFRPVFQAEAKLPPPGPPKLPKPVPPPPLPPVPQAPQPPQVVRDMAQFTFLGFLKKGTSKTIFLARDKEIILVRQGDKIAGKYEATTITDEALSIRSLSDGSEIVIPLVESRPLSAPRK